MSEIEYFDKILNHFEERKERACDRASYYTSDYRCQELIRCQMAIGVINESIWYVRKIKQEYLDAIRCTHCGRDYENKPDE